MTRKEFIRMAEGLGCTVIKDKHEKTYNKVLKIFYREKLIAIIDEEIENHINTMFVKNIASYLFYLMVEYTETPIEDREDPKKYYFKAIDLGSSFHGDRYFNYFISRNSWALSDTHGCEVIKTEFTEREFEDLYNRLGIQIAFEKEEIEVANKC